MVAVEIAALVALFLAAGFLAAAEISLTAVNRIRVRRMVEEGTRGAERLERLTEQRGRYLPVILLLTLVATLGADSLAITLAERYLHGLIPAAVATVLATLLTTAVVFIYCEVGPKTAASQHPERFALAVARVIEVLTRAIYPVTRMFIWLATPLVRVLGGKSMAAGPFVTEEEIKTIVTVGEEEGVIEEVEKEMIHSIFEFGDTVVREVMVPRPDMQTLQLGTPLQDALEAVVSEGHSRIPVWEESPDNVVGLMYAKDLLTLTHKGAEGGVGKELLREAYFVPESKRVSELLKDMRHKQVHIAIAVDEYGGVAGLVTLEDLIEEIVGEIVDEYDVEEPLIEELPDGRLRVDGRLPLEEVGELTSAELDVEDVDSVGGLVYALAGDIPKEGDRYELAGLRFIAERVEGRRIQKVIIERISASAEHKGASDGD